MGKTYPLFFCPVAIIGNNYRSELIGEIEKPLLPKKEIVRDNRVAIFILSIIISLGFFAYAEDHSRSEIHIYILVLLIFYNLYKYITVESDKSSVERRYKLDLNHYYEKERKHKKLETLKAAIACHITEEEMAKVLVLHKLYRNKNVVLTDSTYAKEGISEKRFLVHLRKAFKEKIKTQKKVTTTEGDKTYYPDFIYYDNIRQIYIDIEIDEPYDLTSGNPIHCIGEDEGRNRFFLDINWCVLRFTEHQVTKEPEGCIKTIKNILTCLEINDKQYTINVTKEDVWSDLVARKMEKESYRESYLGIKKVDRSETLQQNHLLDDDLPFCIPHKRESSEDII